jgi:hypothetical protein
VCTAAIFVGLLTAFLSSVPVLGLALARCVDREGQRMALPLTVAVTLGILASLSAVPAWELALVGFGLTSATLAPLMLLGTPPQLSSRALAGGLLTYAALTMLSKLPMEVPIPEVVGRYPVLVGLPITAVTLVLRGR